MYTVPAAGGAPTPVAAAGASFLGAKPSFLPDGRHYLFHNWSTERNTYDVYLGDLGSGAKTRLLEGASGAVFAPPGYVLFVEGDVLMAQPFEPSSGRTVGQPIRVVDGVLSRFQRHAAFAVSTNGVLVYRGGAASNAGARMSQLTWFDRQGRIVGTVGEPVIALQLALAPDERRVAVSRPDPAAKTLDIWTVDLRTGVATRLTFDPADEDDPTWSPDGREIAYWSNRQGRPDFYRMAVGGREELLYESDSLKWLGDWSPSGRFLSYFALGAINVLPITEPRDPVSLLSADNSFFDEPHFSPDERWMAYNSIESGQWEVHVAAFPGFDHRSQVSTGGGGVPFWRSDGKELFYQSADGKIMSIPVTPGPTLEFGTPTMLFQSPLSGILNIDQYAVTADGQRFLVLAPTEATTPPITVAMDWTKLLGR